MLISLSQREAFSSFTSSSFHASNYQYLPNFPKTRFEFCIDACSHFNYSMGLFVKKMLKALVSYLKGDQKNDIIRANFSYLDCPDQLTKRQVQQWKPSLIKTLEADFLLAMPSEQLVLIMEKLSEKQIFSLVDLLSPACIKYHVLKLQKQTLLKFIHCLPDDYFLLAMDILDVAKMSEIIPELTLAKVALLPQALWRKSEENPSWRAKLPKYLLSKKDNETLLDKLKRVVFLLNKKQWEVFVPQLYLSQIEEIANIPSRSILLNLMEYFSEEQKNVFKENFLRCYQKVSLDLFNRLEPYQLVLSLSTAALRPYLLKKNVFLEFTGQKLRIIFCLLKPEYIQQFINTMSYAKCRCLLPVLNRKQFKVFLLHACPQIMQNLVQDMTKIQLRTLCDILAKKRLKTYLECMDVDKLSVCIQGMKKSYKEYYLSPYLKCDEEQFIVDFEEIPFFILAMSVSKKTLFDRLIKCVDQMEYTHFQFIIPFLGAQQLSVFFQALSSKCESKVAIFGHYISPNQWKEFLKYLNQQLSQDQERADSLEKDLKDLGSKMESFSHCLRLYMFDEEKLSSHDFSNCLEEFRHLQKLTREYLFSATHLYEKTQGFNYLTNKFTREDRKRMQTLLEFTKHLKRDLIGKSKCFDSGNGRDGWLFELKKLRPKEEFYSGELFSFLTASELSEPIKARQIYRQAWDAFKQLNGKKKKKYKIEVEDLLKAGLRSQQDYIHHEITNIKELKTYLEERGLQKHLSSYDRPSFTSF